MPGTQNCNNPIWGRKERKHNTVRASMVAISLYRGNLHRVPDVPRRWLMPNPKISIKNFKSLLDRRSKALSRHHHPTTSNPNPNPNPLSNHGEGPSNAAVKEQQQQQQQPHRKESELVAGNSDQKPLINSKNNGFEKASNGAATSIEKQAELPVTDNGGMHTDKQKRKREVEDKLQVLNGKKHNLVLVLKQILNAEEELKRRNSVLQPGVAMRGMSILPQPDGTNDNGSMTRHMTTRSEGNIVGDVDGGGEADDSANHNVQYSHVLRTSSMSPSSESPLRRTPNVQPNVVSHPARASLGATVSPSRFALSGHQGNPMNPPSVSVSGTSYIASSPSPAASGGTSVFRDARQPSPWK